MKRAAAMSEKRRLMNTSDFIAIGGSKSAEYLELLKYKPHALDNDPWQLLFMKKLKRVLDSDVRPFLVPVCDPSIDEDGRLQFIPGMTPAANLSYNQNLDLAEKNGIRLGTQNEYVLFLGTMIIRLMRREWIAQKAWFSVCNDSSELGNYSNPKAKKFSELEHTGSRKICGKCDLANTFKYLSTGRSNPDFIPIASGSYLTCGKNYPIANITTWAMDTAASKLGNRVGWFVF